MSLNDLCPEIKHPLSEKRSSTCSGTLLYFSLYPLTCSAFVHYWKKPGSDLISSPWAFSSPKWLNGPGSLSLFCMRGVPILMSFCWAVSRMSIYVLYWEEQNCTQCSWGSLSSAEQKGRITSLDIRTVNVSCSKGTLLTCVELWIQWHSLGIPTGSSLTRFYPWPGQRDRMHPWQVCWWYITGGSDWYTWRLCCHSMGL